MKVLNENMRILRLAWAAQFLLALIAVFVLWSEIGGQGHLDLLPWYVKFALGVGPALASVKATAAAVSHERAWNSSSLRWLGIMAALLAGCGLATYYAHVNLEYDDQQDEEDTQSSAKLHHGGFRVPPGWSAPAGWRALPPPR
jgi:hypothetical protein